MDSLQDAEVAPLVGAWIEISNPNQYPAMLEQVAPLVGAWIEILRTKRHIKKGVVAPLVGAWIEIVYYLNQSDHPHRRTPRGCVD